MTTIQTTQAVKKKMREKKKKVKLRYEKRKEKKEGEEIQINARKTHNSETCPELKSLLIGVAL